MRVAFLRFSESRAVHLRLLGGDMAEGRKVRGLRFKEGACCRRSGDRKYPSLTTGRYIWGRAIARRWLSGSGYLPWIPECWR